MRTESPVGRLGLSHPVVFGTALLWVVAFCALTLGGDPKQPLFWPLALRRVFVCLFGLGSCLAIFRLVLATERLAVFPRVAALIAVNVVAAAAYSVVSYGAFTWVAPLYKEASPFWMSSVMTLRMTFWFYSACIVGYVAWLNARRAQEAMLALAAARELAAEARHKLLKSQLSPHFLFNTLNAIHSLVLEKRTDTAEKMILSLSGFLRRTLDDDAPDFMTLAEELGVITGYLDIEKARYGARLQCDYRIDANLSDMLVPALILQPLVENCVKHGLSRSRETVTISISAARLGPDVEIVVEDDAEVSAEAARPTRRGLGLANVRQRLEVIYAAAASVTAGPRPSGGFRVSLRLPAPAASFEADGRLAVGGRG